jgi:hypothetical protein
MDGEIIGEKDNKIGTRITDNSGNEQQIEMYIDEGEIYSHNPGEYHCRPENRSRVESEHINQSRRYARYVVYNERGYNVFPWDEDIPRIKDVRKAIEALSEEEFERHFGEFYEAVSGSVDVDTGTSVSDVVSSIRRDADGYYIDVYLDDTGEIERTSEVTELTGLENIVEKFKTPPEESDRLPDARIDLLPNPVPNISVFQDLVAYQTKCQVRDYHIVMGEEPPEEYRVLGFGKYKFAAKYRDDRLTMYDDYTRFDVDIPGYRVELGIGDVPQVEGQLKTILKSLNKVLNE